MTRWKKAALAALVTIGVLGGTEAVLRVTLPVARKASMPQEVIEAHLEGEAFRYDPDLGWYWKHLGVHGLATNAFGFRRTEAMSFEKPAGVTRVVTLGDSQTYGAGVKPDESYSAVAESELGEDWEVLNAGLSGYRSLNIYRLLKLRVAAFDPDVVVIDAMPFDSPRDDGVVVGRALREPWVDTARRLLWNSRLYYMLRLAMEKADSDRPRWLDQAVTARAEPGRRDFGNHDLIAAWGAEEGIAVVFMQYPVMDEQGRLSCQTRPGELPPDNPVVPACDAILAAGKPGQILFQDRNHLTVLGNQVVGHALAETLRSWKATASP